MYRQHFGVTPIEIEQPSADLDVSAAWTADKDAVTIAIVNHTMTAHEVAVNLANFAAKDAAKQWEIKGTDPEAHNVPGKEPEVKIEEKAFTFSKTLPGAAIVGGIVPAREAVIAARRLYRYGIAGEVHDNFPENHYVQALVHVARLRRRV